jgi:hypothetical protein
VISNNFTSAIYNRRAGQQDAITFGETKIPQGSQPAEKIKTMATKSKAKKPAAKKPAAKKKKK